MTELCEALAQNLRHFYFFDKLTFPPQGGRCPEGADEGASGKGKRQIFYLTHPYPAAHAATFPLPGGRFRRRVWEAAPREIGRSRVGASGGCDPPLPHLRNVV